MEQVKPSGSNHHTMSSSRKIPHPHLPAVSHAKTFPEKSTDLHVAQVGNRHDSHFRDIVTTTRTKQMTMTDCVAVYNLPLKQRDVFTDIQLTCSMLLELSLH